MSNTDYSAIIIRDVEGIAEMRAVEDLQKEVWKVNDRDVVPSLMLIPAKEVGGILLGAFDEGILVGFAFGFVGLERKQVVLHSDMLAVRPAYRNHGLGYKLKLAQRERALVRGITRMTWTFDPLQCRNAHLNFAKLGVTSDAYKVDFYGAETSSYLHQNVGTDRLWVTWELDDWRVEQRLRRESNNEDALLAEFEKAHHLVRLRADDSPQTASLSEIKGEQVLIEIPPDIIALQHENLELAVRWREATRHAFSEAMAAGFIVTEFFHARRRGGGTYLLNLSK